MTKNKFYITTPIYYANGSPHIGHFLTTTFSDTLARFFRKKLGDENVFFTTGLDEHGTTVEQSALKEGYTLDNFQEYVDKRAVEWKNAFDNSNISYNYFVRTTNKEHEKFAQEFIRKMVEKGDVYKGTYKGKYCNGCEKFLTLSDLNDEGFCPLHRKDQVIDVEEKNYFFKLSKYAEEVSRLIETDQILITPKTKKNEVLSRLKAGVEDTSISRPKEKVSWGIEFPEDPDQTIYVWVEALMNYISSLKINNKNIFWENCTHVLGKDINWFHNVIWPAFLISADYPLYKKSFVHGFLTISGQKISKSLGNVITPTELIEKYGVDGARYVILSNFPSKNDSDVSWEQLDDKYNADLANGLGNTVARLAKLAERSKLEFEYDIDEKTLFEEDWTKPLTDYKVDEAIKSIWQQLASLDKHINENEPWAIENRDKLREVLSYEIKELRKILIMVEPFIPDASIKAQKTINQTKIKGGLKLFPRLS